MRTSTALLATALAVLLVIPSSLGRPSSSSKKSRSLESSSFSASESSSSEEQIRAANGLYEKKSKEDSSKAVSQNAQKSSESFVSENNGSGSVVKAQKSQQSSSSSAFATSSSEQQEIIRNGNCGCQKKKAADSKSTKKELCEAEIKTIYCQQKGESLEAYFKRIVTKTEYTSTTDSYVKILNIVRKDFCKLDLWYDIKYIDLVKDYYTALYTKATTESEDVYYSRIIKKESWESEEQYAKRIIVVRDLFPTLPLWTEESYFSKYTKSVYATVYKKYSTESQEEYVKRIFAKDSFFDKSDEIWAKRVFLIQEATISNSIWYEEKYFQYIKDFYSLFYKKVEKETSDAWLTRVLKPLQGESFDQAIKRIRLVKKATEKYGCWKVDFLNKVQATKSFVSEYLSKIKKEFFELSEKEIKTTYCQKKEETVESYFKRIVTRTDYTSTTESYLETLNIVRRDFSKLDLWYDIKYIDLVKDYYTALYTKATTESEDVYYSRIIKKESWESEEQYAKRIIVVRDLFPTLPLWTEDSYFSKYTKSVYATVYKKYSTESQEEYVKRIFAKDSFFDKSDEIWAKRVFLIQEATISNSIWYEEKYFQYIKDFYSLFYKKVEKETSDVWLTRVLKPLQGESIEQAIKRIRLIKKATETYGCWKLDYFKKVQTTKCFQSEYLSKIQREFFELSEKEIKTTYCQKKEETVESYFKRIVTRTDYTSTTESYLKTLNIVRRDFSKLDLWYDIKYIDLVKDYYTALYTKATTESEDVYYSRIIKKESWESEEQYAKRIIVVRDLFPTLPLWTEDSYFSKYTKSVYATVYKKYSTESQEEYVKRIFAKDSFFDKSDEIWAKRVFLIQEATISNSIWYEEKYFQYIKNFYSLYYKKVEKETSDVWLTRVLKPLQGESFEQAIKRIRLIKKATESYGCWKLDYFKKIQTTKCFQSEYLSKIQREFFELSEKEIKTTYCQKKEETVESYFKRIVTRTDYTSTTESYLKTLNIVRRDFSKLDLWYDIKYIDLVKDYYTALYTKATTESEDVYYSRIIKKESWESEEQYAKRIIVVRDLFPTLPLWTEDSYFSKYTKSVYATVYKKYSTESQEEYVKRIFAKDSFFDKSDEIWAKRVFLIQEATISNSIWYEEKYFQYIKDFYSLFYKKVEKETSDVWLTRVLKPLQGESIEQAIKRIRLIKKATETYGCWKLDYFKKVQTTKCFQSEYLSKIQREFFELSEKEIKTTYCQKKEETVESYFKRIVTRTDYTSTTESYLKTLNIVRRDFSKLDLWYDIKYIDLVKDYYTALYTKATTESEDVYYSRIIKKESWESEEQYAKRIIVVRDLFPTLPLWTEDSYFSKYTKSVYATVYKKYSTESEEEYVKRIFAKDSFFDKSDEIWAKRVFLIQEATISNSIWYEEKYFQYIKNFYSLYYKKVEKETSDVWLTRVLKPLQGESFEQAIKRIRLIKKATETYGCWKLDYFKKVQTTKCFQSEYLSKIQRAFFELSESDIKTIYCQQKGESLEAYFKRIVAKTEYTSTTESYIKILNVVRRDFATLSLWYDTKFIDLIKEYYSAVYVKKSTESEEAYYSRIIRKDSWESEEQYAKRIIIVRDLFPSLSLWADDNYFAKYTKSLYAVIFKKQENESVEEYIKRIFARDSFFDTTDDIWAKRLFFIQQATIYNSIWYEEKYFQYIKDFYSVFYKKLEKETCEAWLTRALRPFEGETFDQTIKRIHFIKKVTGNCGCWKVDIFKLVKAAKSFQSEYLCKIEKEFFKTQEYYKSEKSQKSSKSSSFSSSSSEEELKANSASGEFEKKSSSSQSAANSKSSSESNEAIFVARG